MFTIFVGIIAFVFIPFTPQDSRFLTKYQKESASKLSMTSLHVLTLLSSGLS
jgi:hypothetical protein